MMLVKCILPDEKPEIIPLPQQSVLDKGDFIFDPTTLISVENEKQAMIAQELTGIFNQAAGFSPQIAIQEKQADIIFRTDMSLSAEHYKLNISPSCILVEASGNKGFFYAIQTLRFLLPPAINSQSTASPNRTPTVLPSAAFTIISCAVHSFNSMAVFFRPLQYFAPTNPPDFVIFPSSTDSKVRWEISQSSNLNVCPAAPFDIVLPITPPAAVFALITVFFTTHSVKLLSP